MRDKLDLVANFVASRLRSSQGRLIAGLSALGSLAWLLWPSPHWKLEPEPLYAFLIASVAWGGSILESPNASDHDRKLFGRFRDKVDADCVLFLYRHDFGGSFELNRLYNLFDVADGWQGAEYEFDDPQIQRRFATLLLQMSQFARYLAHNTWVIDGSEGWSTATPGEADGDWSDRARKRVDKLNDDGTSLAKAIDAFVHFARKRL